MLADLKPHSTLEDQVAAMVLGSEKFMGFVRTTDQANKSFYVKKDIRRDQDRDNRVVLRAINLGLMSTLWVPASTILI